MGKHDLHGECLDSTDCLFLTFVCVCPLCYFAHASHWDAAESSQHVSLDAGRRLKHKDTPSTKQIHWHLVVKHSSMKNRN